MVADGPLMAGGLTVTCPTCGRLFPVPSEVLGVDQATDQVIVRLDRTELYGHLSACAGREVETTERGAAMERHPAGGEAPDPTPIDQMLDPKGLRFVAKGGSRACTMCGINGKACFAMLKGLGLANGKVVHAACCGPCAEGNTHPAPQEDATCQQWGAEHGAES